MDSTAWGNWQANSLRRSQLSAVPNRYRFTKRLSMRSFQRHTQAPFTASRPQEATAYLSPQLIRARERECERNGSGDSPASARRRLPARTGPRLTPHTPALPPAPPLTPATPPTTTPPP